MYKTIRHGENSLQYTILPQNDDFRIEGKLSNANRLAASSSAGGAAGAGAGAASASSSSSSSSSSASASSSSATCHKRNASAPRKRRTFFAYLGLIFVCTVIIGAVLIPFLVSAECLPSPTEWFLKTKAAFTHSDRPQHLQQQQQLQHGTATTAAAAASPLGAAMLGKTVQIVNRNGVEQFILKINKTLPSSSSTTSTTTTTTTSTSTTTTTTSTTAATTLAMEQAAVPSTAPATILLPPLATAAAATTVAPPPLSNGRLPATLTTRIIQVPLLKSAAKKPIMPPVLAKTQSNSQQQQQQQQLQLQLQSPTSNTDVAQNKSNNAWMNTHWAYIDPSTYVQWSGYKAEDSVLLPALLGFALIGMILIITVCLVARNKRTIVSSVRKRNRNDIEEQGAEDNATLLTTTNLSDDD
ncbi:hypothetical protein KR093_005988 [Drosophila rubida]|uniref:Mucin-5AC n=1 Tax=Drosophila rubida TaxID=30044 RepID=A0AAD4PRY1_9MUSC|nr:hypothetical protein KR093_005988 [Drosophila rubida]